MEEWSEQQIKQRLEASDERLFIYFYTPMCGTCKVTERMLQVVLAMEPNLPLVKCNANYCPGLTQSWKVESVPCIASIERRSLTRKRYRMQGVADLLQWFQESA
ncbi:thioredoxin family protein [Paenibacillus vulneris]|uniref:Thioredoxin family protein n=1 Tax=Paenibacillus vulneris TaxID=1133364 RepID=A0ABW3UFL5_9BACL|nr:MULTISPECIES: thioredoxin family protein [unclassified Paenibacillus]MBE1441859.1 thioredoxin-like negative regulator of GroEL [Paenibacillus sp. OAS669]